ncbi:hypothetical protein ACIQFP_10630 [Nocardiopsis alba]|uniref:hypothetical protein n=1 Tax=Nocardiopsis alba TaxID=53437 RepID=UPI0037FD3BC9
MSWIDYSQNVRIRDLEESLGSAYSQMTQDRKRMRSELSHLKGDLGQRLDRVSATLDAFIELSDLRVTLSLFDGMAITRHRTLQMLDGAFLGELRLDDVPGYWLVPAARGLHHLLNGDLPRARARFAEAAEIDRERALGFTALATALTSSENAHLLGSGAATELLPHLPLPEVRPTRVQRALWLLSADGSFGDDAREHLLLSTLRHWSAEDARVATVEAWSATAPSTSGGRGHTPSKDPFAVRSRAAKALGRLREQVSHVTGPNGEDEPDRVLAPDQASVDFLKETLRLLVEEGGPEEAPLLAEARALRATIENGGEKVEPPHWNEGTDDVATLIQRDLTSTDTPLRRRTFALVVQRTTVLEDAERLAADLNTPLPETTTVSTQGVDVTIDAAGADQGQIERVRGLISERHTAGGDARSMVWVTLGIAAVLGLLALFTMNGFLWFLTLVSLGGSVLAHHSSTKGRGEGEAAIAEARRRTDERIAGAVEEWRRRRLQAEEETDAARRDLREIRRMLSV